MAQISYEGALNHLNRGDIFHGLRFFISKACPSRNGYIEKVEYNGGEIVRKESEANILIFDHLNSRRNPINSVSYKFIDESIKIRRRVDVGEYPAGPRFKHVRSSGYSAPIKNTRTPFSLEDDKELLEHVRKAEKQGMKVLGNKVYQDLEEKNPRHTWQSWQARWVKNLRLFRPPLKKTDHVPEPSYLTPQPLQEATRISFPNEATNLISNSNVSERVSKSKSLNDTQKTPSMDPLRHIEAQGPNSQIAKHDLTVQTLPPSANENDKNGQSERKSESSGRKKKRRRQSIEDASRDIQKRLPNNIQDLDLDLAPPSKGWDMLLTDESSLFRNSAESIGAKSKQEKTLDEWINSKIRGNLTSSMIQDALFYTSMDLGLAEKVLHTISNGGGIPKLKGVWSREDDCVVQGNSSRDIERLALFHGEKAFDRRWLFLNNFGSNNFHAT